MHGLAKAGLFLCAGHRHPRHPQADIREMGGLIKTMPVTAVAFLFCAFSVIGIPPFGGFFSKFLVIMGTVKARPGRGSRRWPCSPPLLTMFYLFRVFSQVFLGEAKAPAPEKDAGPWSPSWRSWPSCRSSAGLFISYPAKLAEIDDAHIMGWLK